MPVLSAQPVIALYGNLENATSFSVTQNSIYIVEQGKNRLVRIDHTGKLIATIGGKGSGDYQFSKPVDVDATNGLKIFVTDYNNRRVQVFDRRGQYLSSIAGRSSFNGDRVLEPTQISVNRLGEVFFVDEYSNHILHYSMDYNLLDEFRIPSEIKMVDDMKVGNEGILILEKETGIIHELELNGSYKGFYHAEGTGGFYAEGDTVWKAGEKGLMMNQGSQENQIVEFNRQIQGIGLHVGEDVAFILGSNSLYKIALN